ncbi:GTP-binding protein [uncultured Microscilla sp.]|uniref:sulfate adenylyltransferase subunit 1 n=1 Tax=uncultured Microscilla sp. TaxID=432653 RepID=UPI002622C2C9|nr:GTP-binding protein [uncultured Microscilla sp.]
MDILRFITAGSVDDGKSTLIGRLLFDSQSILDDQLEAISRASKNKQNGEIDLALLTDGLRSEREQGITIDVAYKYFNTSKRKFIIADSPGHVQYTRNMVTGASNSDLAIILIDGRNGVIEQTRRHSFICNLLGIKHFVVCINKMDLVDYSQAQFDKIVADYKEVTKGLDIPNLTFIPVSALDGDNVVEPSEKMPWYEGKPLLRFLEEVDVDKKPQLSSNRFQVQWVIRPQTADHPDYRGYAGKVLSGVYRKGDEVTVLPSGTRSKIKALEINQEEIEEAFAPMSVVLHLEDDIDISRGDMIVPSQASLSPTRQITASICWMDTQPLEPNQFYLLRHNSNTTRVKISDFVHKIDIETLQETTGADKFDLNDLGQVQLKTAQEILIDNYKENPANGSFILVDEHSHNTVAAGMVVAVS